MHESLSDIDACIYLRQNAFPAPERCTIRQMYPYQCGRGEPEGGGVNRRFLRSLVW